MRRSVMFLCAAAAFGLTSFRAEAACNVRGEYCGYPSWASNAFSGPDDRVSDYSLDYPTDQTAYGYVAPETLDATAYGYQPSDAYVERRIRRRM